jgi:ribosomal protein S18 acetylase RimI-like enzyme
MTKAAYEAWLARLIAEYAAENVRSGHWRQEEALERAERQTMDLLADGPATPGHQLWTITDESGIGAGVLWVSTATERPGYAFIYDIEIEPGRRGEGLGTAALNTLEKWARANGITVIGLHVFGHNDGARRLYRRLGYVETSVQMEKRL